MMIEAFAIVGEYCCFMRRTRVEHHARARILILVCLVVIIIALALRTTRLAASAPLRSVRRRARVLLANAPQRESLPRPKLVNVGALEPRHEARLGQ
jgi:hypothetical protein